MYDSETGASKNLTLNVRTFRWIGFMFSEILLISIIILFLFRVKPFMEVLISQAMLQCLVLNSTVSLPLLYSERCVLLSTSLMVSCESRIETGWNGSRIKHLLIVYVTLCRTGSISSFAWSSHLFNNSETLTSGAMVYCDHLGYWENN